MYIYMYLEILQIYSPGGALPKKAPTRLNSMRQSHTHSTPKVFLRKVPFPLYEKTGANEQNTPFLRQLNIVTFAGLFTPTLLSQNVYNHLLSTLCQTKQYPFHSYTYCSLIQSPFHSNSCLNSTLFLENTMECSN